MKRFATLLAILALTGFAANAADFGELGFSKDTQIQEPGNDECVGTLFYNHDGSFENGYCWQYGGIVPPYYGAFGEGYDLGAVFVECSAHWLSQTGAFVGQPADIYLWDGGVTGAPGGVLSMVAGVVFDPIAFWPSCSQHDVEIGYHVGGEFTVGYWADFSNEARNRARRRLERPAPPWTNA